MRLEPSARLPKTISSLRAESSELDLSSGTPNTVYRFDTRSFEPAELARFDVSELAKLPNYT